MLKLSNILSESNKNLLSEMVRTDFKLRYQGSILGYAWSLLKPLMLFAILYTVFSRFLRFGEDVPNFAVSLLLGMVLWNFFLEATNSSLQSVVVRGDLIRKIQIPRYLIVVSSVILAGINLLLNLVVVLIFILFSDADLGWHSLWAIPIILELVVFTASVSFFLAAAFVRFRDINYIWEVGLQGLFFLAPIIYPLSKIPSELARQAILLNPLAQIIQDARAVLTHSGTTQIYDVVSPTFVAVPFILVLFTLMLGSLYFKRESKTFAENV